jgi:hypothetical protein
MNDIDELHRKSVADPYHRAIHADAVIYGAMLNFTEWCDGGGITSWAQRRGLIRQYAKQLRDAAKIFIQKPEPVR